LGGQLPSELSTFAQQKDFSPTLISSWVSAPVCFPVAIIPDNGNYPTNTSFLIHNFQKINKFIKVLVPIIYNETDI